MLHNKAVQKLIYNLFCKQKNFFDNKYIVFNLYRAFLTETVYFLFQKHGLIGLLKVIYV